MLSRTVEYAVRAVIVLARHYGERLVSADEIASILGAPRNYLSKTLNTLTRRGILTSARGPGGGYALAVAPSELSVADITDVFADARPEVARCLLADTPCDPTHPCPFTAGRTISRLARAGCCRLWTATSGVW